MKVVANTRNAQGTGASRRLRHLGKVPGVLYGGKADAQAIEVDHNDLFHALRKEKFHASILDMELDGKTEKVLLRDVQWHPYKPVVMHIDFQRVAADEKLTVKVPLHFVNQEISPAVKLSAAIIGHVVNEIEISCLPGDLPSFIEVDLANLETTQTIHANDIKLPAGVSLASHGAENPVIVTVTVPAGGEEAAGEAEKK